ncbi:MAG: hypothetical protein WDA74_06345 [Spirochaetota bacterium]
MKIFKFCKRKSIEKILINVTGKFQESEKLLCINTFIEYTKQREQWFNGYLLFYFAKYKSKNIIDDCFSEYAIQNGKIDFKLIINNIDYYIEIKHWLDRYCLPLS